MKMVVGGAYQGQLEWAKEHFPEIPGEQWADGKSCGLEQVFCCKGIYDFQEYIRRVMGRELDKKVYMEPAADLYVESVIKDLASELIRRNPDILIVSNEIGYGLVPQDACDRVYRELAGRVCTELAAFSDQVVRVVMGIGTRIK